MIHQMLMPQNVANIELKYMLIIIDTPLHGFDEDDSENAPESMKAGLFNYSINYQQGQLIVIVNLEHIPHLDYAASGANVITFTKRKVEGERYRI